MHEATIGAHTTTDRVESNFGCYDYVLRRWVGIAPENASGIAQQMRMHDLERASKVVSDCRKAKAPQLGRSMGYFWSLPEALQRSLVEACRRFRLKSRGEARNDRKAQLAYKQRKQEENIEKQQNRTINLYAKSLRLFPAWQEKGFTDIGQADKLIKDKALSDGVKKKQLKDQVALAPAASAQLTHIAHRAPSRAASFSNHVAVVSRTRRQIEMRVVALGMSEFETPFSSTKWARSRTCAACSRTCSSRKRRAGGMARRRFCPMAALPPLRSRRSSRSRRS
eukprot:7074928-Prymnesium_polylepis.1